MSTMHRIILAGLAAVVFFSPSRSWAWSTQGGETLSKSENALHAGTGFPWAIQTGYHIPVMNNFEIIPNFGLYYGVDTSVPTVGATLTAGLKFRLLQSGKFHLALVGEPGFIMNFHPGIFLFGLNLGLPQVLGTYNISNVFALHFGLRMPIAIIFGRKGSPTFAYIPILARFGMEYTVSSNVNIFALMDMGVGITAASGGSKADFSPSFLFGGVFRF